MAEIVRRGRPKSSESEIPSGGLPSAQRVYTLTHFVITYDARLWYNRPGTTRRSSSRAILVPVCEHISFVLATAALVRCVVQS